MLSAQEFETRERKQLLMQRQITKMNQRLALKTQKLESMIHKATTKPVHSELPYKGVEEPSTKICIKTIIETLRAGNSRSGSLSIHGSRSVKPTHLPRQTGNKTIDLPKQSESAI